MLNCPGDIYIDQHLFYLHDPTKGPDYVERMKSFTQQLARSKETKEAFGRRMTATRKTEHDKLAMLFVDHVIENYKQ